MNPYAYDVVTVYHPEDALITSEPVAVVMAKFADDGERQSVSQLLERRGYVATFHTVTATTDRAWSRFAEGFPDRHQRSDQ